MIWSDNNIALHQATGFRLAFGFLWRSLICMIAVACSKILPIDIAVLLFHK